MTAGFDPAMGFLDLGRNLDLIMWSLVEVKFDLGMGGSLVVLGGEKIIAAEIDDLFGDLRLKPIASMLTRLPPRAPEAASSASSRGIAVIWLDLSATARCPSTSLCVVAKAET